MSEHPHPPVLERVCDVAVLGGSAAGLAAALQLARQRRSVLVVDDATPRNAPAEHVHGYLGREGTPPAELAAIGREEVRSYGGEVLTGRAVDVSRQDDGRLRVAVTGGHALLARRVVVATGLHDELPDVEGLAEHWGRSVVHCPFCHGYEVRDSRVVQLVTSPMGLHPTALLRSLTDRLTVVVHDGTGIDDAALAPLTAAGVPVLREKASRVVTDHGGRLTGLELVDGTVLDADAVLVGTRFAPRLDALAGLGLTATPHATGAGEALETDAFGETTAPGVYAAGNVTDPSLQVLNAAAHGARVGAMVAFSLAGEDLAAAARPSGAQADWEHRYGGDRVWSANPNGTLVNEVGDLPPGRALDVGAGEGADALWLAERGWQVTANDISAAALARVADEAARRGLAVTTLRGDANDLDAFGSASYDLVSLQYGSFTRTPEQRGLRNVLAAVAPGGTLLVVHHDLTPLQHPVDVATQTRMYDPAAFVGVDAFAAALADDPDWTVELHETRPRPPGAVSTHHVDDVVLRARRL
jgi:thioredoxin reductase/SAM-dependent methyltransferase